MQAWVPLRRDQLYFCLKGPTLPRNTSRFQGLLMPVQFIVVDMMRRKKLGSHPLLAFSTNDVVVRIVDTLGP